MDDSSEGNLSGELCRVAVEASISAVCVFDRDNLALLGWNSTAVARYGYSGEELSGMTLAQLHDPEELTALAEELASLDTGLSSEARRTRPFKHRHKDGRSLDVEMSLCAALHADRRVVVALMDDVSDRARFELRRAATLEAALDAVISIDTTGNVIEWNGAAERMFGRRREDVLGREMAELVIPPELRDRHRQGLARFVATGQGPVVGRRIEITGMRAEGTFFPVELTISAIRAPGGELTFTAFLRALEDAAAATRRHDVLPVVAHELRAPLTAIQGCLGALVDSGPAPRDRNLLDLASRATARMNRLIGDLLDLESTEAGRMTMARERIEIAGLLQEACEYAGGQAAAHGVSLVLGEASPDVFVEGDRERLLQVLANLLSNAIHFSPCGETVRLASGRRNGMARVEVTDRGPGVPEAFRIRIFQKFARLHGAPAGHKGSGLGLAISKLIVEVHGGRIGFEPPPGGGTTFYFELPELGPRR